MVGATRDGARGVGVLPDMGHIGMCGRFGHKNQNRIEIDRANDKQVVHKYTDSLWEAQPDRLQLIAEESWMLQWWSKSHVSLDTRT